MAETANGPMMGWATWNWLVYGSSEMLPQSSSSAAATINCEESVVVADPDEPLVDGLITPNRCMKSACRYLSAVMPALAHEESLREPLQPSGHP